MHFFFQYGNEQPFVIDNEKQAWDLLRTSQSSKWVKKGLKYIGQSKGIIYKSVMAGIVKQQLEISNKIKKVQQELINYEKGFEKAKFEELLEANDVKLLKFKSIIESKEEEIQALSKEMEILIKPAKEEAFNGELEEARGNTTPPGDFTIEMGSLNEKNIPLTAIKSRI